MKFSVAIPASLLVLASIVAAKTVNEVKSDIIAIDAGVVNLYQHCQVESLNYLSGLAIRQAADDLTSKIKTGAADVNALEGKPTDADAKLILSTLGKTEVKVKMVVDQMIKLKPEFEKLGVLGMAQSSVSSFQQETKSFSAQLVKLAPSAEQSAATSLAGRFNADLDKCAAAYNGGSGQAASKRRLSDE
ncbi:hypothetical protein PHSY_006104 [Pseudozyma hubeiensis SY62]|uniref:Cell wall protein n=1 Tax=Pseudozyma hubeiensis (strain SY62) TaxID=1305764 RepID=R9PK70_PSEHS|nr:hypothetical protein PHSY_006104 [Pseudozyma hubeiensis SY62]GAC98510.1 hypothetical protein PHSY_006104 [Pseudozyma hubeiensis SY62]